MGPHTISEAQALSKTHPGLQHTVSEQSLVWKRGAVLPHIWSQKGEDRGKGGDSKQMVQVTLAPKPSLSRSFPKASACPPAPEGCAVCTASCSQSRQQGGTSCSKSPPERSVAAPSAHSQGLGCPQVAKCRQSSTVCSRQ